MVTATLTVCERGKTVIFDYKISTFKYLAPSKLVQVLKLVQVPNKLVQAPTKIVAASNKIVEARTKLVQASTSLV